MLELFDAEMLKSCDAGTGSGRSSGLSARFLSSDFFGLWSFEVVGRTRRVDSMLSVAERCTRVRWKVEMPLPLSFEAVGTVAVIARREGRDSISDCGRHGFDCASVSIG